MSAASRASTEWGRTAETRGAPLSRFSANTDARDGDAHAHDIRLALRTATLAIVPSHDPARTPSAWSHEAANWHAVSARRYTCTMTGWYQRRIVPHIVRLGCGCKLMADYRRQIIPKARGRVLEIGLGAGANLRFYDAAKVTQVLGIEPSPELRAMARRAERSATIAGRDRRCCGRRSAIRRRQFRHGCLYVHLVLGRGRRPGE